MRKRTFEKGKDWNKEDKFKKKKKWVDEKKLII